MPEVRCIRRIDVTRNGHESVSIHLYVVGPPDRVRPTRPGGICGHRADRSSRRLDPGLDRDSEVVAG